MREDVIGRANVADTPELEAYYDRLGSQDSYALWTVANSIEPWEPKPSSMPVLWSYDKMRPLVLQALDLVSPEKAGRRVIALENPGRKGLSACVGWLYTGLQVMRPANSQPQTFVRVAGFPQGRSGAYTVWTPQDVALAGDFVITPNGTWHDHGVDAASRPPCGRTGSTCCGHHSTPISYAVHPEHVQTRTIRSTTSMGNCSPGLLPMGASLTSPTRRSQVRLGSTYDALFARLQATTARRTTASSAVVIGDRRPL